MNKNNDMNYSSIFGNTHYVPDNCKDKEKMEKDFVEFTKYLVERFEDFGSKNNINIIYYESIYDDIDNKIYIFLELNSNDTTERNYQENQRCDPFNQLWHEAEVKIDFFIAEEKEDCEFIVSWQNTNDIFKRKFSEFSNNKSILDNILEYIEEEYIRK